MINTDTPNPDFLPPTPLRLAAICLSPPEWPQNALERPVSDVKGGGVV